MTINVGAIPVDQLKVNSVYGPRGSEFHLGVDLGPATRGKDGDSIYAVQTGLVKVAGYSSSYGNYVVIDHGTLNFCSLYAHLSHLLVSAGSVIKFPGQLIGRMGTTGNSTGTHLHFELRNIPYSKWSGSWNKRNCEDPMPYLNNANYSGVPMSQPYDFTYERVILNQNNVLVGNKLYGRKYRLLVFDEVGQGIDISDLHFTFDCEKVMGGNGTTSKITVYNLNARTEGYFMDRADRLTLEAGYEGLFGVIFDGDVIQCIRSKENGTDFKLVFTCKDGDRFANEAFVNMSVSSKQTRRDIIENIASSATVPSKLGDISETYNEGKYIRGKVMFGKAADYIQQIGKINNGSFYMENGSVNLIRLQDGLTESVVKLDSESGLLGTPQQSEIGVNFKALLNPKIRLNTLVNIDNKQIIAREYEDGSAMGKILDADGVYRVIRLSYIGDNRGNDWHIECEAASQSGAIPQIFAQMGVGL